VSYNSVDTLNLGKFLQIVFSDGVRNQISQDYRDWEMIKRAKVESANGRELRFLFQKSLGTAAVQYRNPNGSSTFPSAQQISTSENTAKHKEIDVTIELEYNLWNRARMSPAKYAEPLALEIQSKTTASKRRLASDLYNDGTGVVGQVGAGAQSIASNVITLPLETNPATRRGFVGFFEYGDLLLNYTLAASANLPTVSGGTFYAWRIVDRIRPTDVVKLEPVDSSGNQLTCSSTGNANLPAASVFYRVGQPTIPDLTAPVADYGTLTEVMAGLESLTASDGRIIHGITMSGASAGSTYDAAASPLDVSHIQAAMDNAKVRVGQDAYRWKMMSMAPEAHAALIESRETDRRFISVEDNKRGIRFFAYQHNNDSIESYTSEFIPKDRVYFLPENGATKQKVIEYHGSDFEPVRMGGMGEFHLKPASTGGHERKIVSYLEAIGVIVCKHPAAIARIQNFTL